MSVSPAFLFRVVLNISGEIYWRAKNGGVFSGWICAKTHAMNAGLRIRNRLCRKPLAECPCCGWTGFRFRFLDCGKFIVPDVECPQCRGHERHRLLHMLLTRRAPEFMRQTHPGLVLHFAPERQVRSFIDQNPRLFTLSTDYTRHGLRNADTARFLADIHHLPLKDAALAGLFCLHVLEHVRDDRAAVRELHRVLAAEGQAIIMVPFMMNQTETIEYGRPDPEMYDHVRGYSPLDFKDRLSPFTYEEIMPASLMTPGEIARYHVPDSQAIYICRK